MLKLSIFAFQHGWTRTAKFLLEVDCLLAGLGGVSRRIRREQRRRQRQARADGILMSFAGWM